MLLISESKVAHNFGFLARLSYEEWACLQLIRKVVS